MNSTAFTALIWWVIPIGAVLGAIIYGIWITKYKKKFDNEQINLPSNLRRSADVILDKYYVQKRKSELHAKEEGLNFTKGQGMYNIDEVNDQAYEVYSKEALVPCEHCGRTFLTDRLLVHLKSCKGKKAK